MRTDRRVGAAVTAAVTAIAFPELIRRLAALVLPPIDLVVGIGRGGVVPAALAAQRLECDLRVLPVRFRDDAHQPERAEPLVTPPAFDVAGKRVLLVDGGRGAHRRHAACRPARWTAPPPSTRWWSPATPITPCSRWIPALPGRGRPRRRNELPETRWAPPIH